MKNDLLKIRKSIISKKNYKLVKIFDSVEKTSGEKDVSLCKTVEGKLVILRVGEIHPKTFFQFLAAFWLSQFFPDIQMFDHFL